jgi:hypothetical protein
MNEFYLNSITEAELRLEVGHRGMLFLEEFVRWLELSQDQISEWQSKLSSELGRKQFTNWFPTSPRMAPSLICKSEVELFGRSMPRFGFRIQTADGGFLNVRRLASFAGQLYPDNLVPREVIELVRNAPCVADAFLKPPSRNTNDWHYLSAPFAKVCGELEHESADIQLTPFVRHMKPGGGMCAQAVSFMAAALHRDLDAPVHGMPEITFIATEKNGIPPASISFDGLSTSEIAHYFNSKRNDRLAARWEASKLLFPAATSLNDPAASLIADYEHALRCYILSNVPVIAPVDVGRMQGISGSDTINYYQTNVSGSQTMTLLNDPLTDPDRVSIFKKNGLRNLEHSAEQLKELAHVVLVVGCTKKSTGDDFAPERYGKNAETLFAFNDPAHFPFMTANAHDLVLVSSYTSSESPVETMLLGWMLPVVPRAVKMPLLDESEGDAAGILNISHTLKDISFKCPNGTEVKKILSGERKPQFRLIQCTRTEIFRQTQEILQWDTNKVETTYGRFFEHFSDDRNAPWCWLEIDHANVLLWDAQKSIPKADLLSLGEAAVLGKTANDADIVRERVWQFADLILIGAYVQDLKGISVFARAPVPSASIVTPLPSLSARLTPCLLTSFEVVRSWDDVSKQCQDECVEFYMFMQKTAEQIFVPKPPAKWNLRNLLKRRRPPVEPLEHSSALQFMAANSTNEKLKVRVATTLLASHPQIVAIATYLPSLCAGERGPDTDINPALLALEFVLGVIIEMKKKAPERAPKILELVGGTRLLARVDVNPKTGNYDVRCIEEHFAIENIIECVAQVLPLIDQADIEVAFEFEPSCLMALGSIRALQIFIANLQKRAIDDPRWKRVGLNLDIAHFAFIEGCRPSFVPPEILDYAVHAHISLHTRGHFADGILEDDEMSSNSKKHRALEWLRTIANLKNEKRAKGFVSLELECAKTWSQVERSFNRLKEWL